MRPRRVQSARLRLAMLFATTSLLLGAFIVIVLYAVATQRASISVTSVVPVGSGGEIIVPVPPAAPAPPGTNSTTTVQPRSLRLPSRAVAATLVADQHAADDRILLEGSAIVLGLSTLVAGLLGWLAAGRVLRPLRAMTEKAQLISAGNLGERLQLTGRHDEFKLLGDTLDDLLGRLEASFEAQRRFVANASHELRTPLTFDRTLLQVALADPEASAAALRRTCEELLVSGREQERLIDALLTLAISERGIARREPADLAGMAGRACAAAALRAQAGEVTISTLLGPALAWGDPALIERLISNLVDNAVRYNHPGGRVEVRTTMEGGGGGVIEVANTGEQLTPEEIEGLFEPFRRRGEARPAEDEGHHGLGLSIVRAIASAHGAHLSADPGPDGGLVVVVRFPADAPD